MTRFQGVNNNGEELSSMYVDHDPQAFSTDTGGPSLTRQEFADECDINVLMAQYEKTGVLNHYNQTQPQYLDVSAVPDLAQALIFVDEAKTAFMTLPASVRRDFDNNPVKFVEFAENPENLEQMRKWNLAPPAPQEPEPQRVFVTNSPETPAS